MTLRVGGVVRRWRTRVAQAVISPPDPGGGPTESGGNWVTGYGVIKFVAALGPAGFEAYGPMVQTQIVGGAPDPLQPSDLFWPTSTVQPENMYVSMPDGTTWFVNNAFTMYELISPTNTTFYSQIGHATSSGYIVDPALDGRNVKVWVNGSLYVQGTIGSVASGTIALEHPGNVLLAVGDVVFIEILE